MSYVAGCDCGGCSTRSTDVQIDYLHRRIARLEELLENTTKVADQRAAEILHLTRDPSWDRLWAFIRDAGMNGA